MGIEGGIVRYDYVSIIPCICSRIDPNQRSMRLEAQLADPPAMALLLVPPPELSF